MKKMPLTPMTPTISILVIRTLIDFIHSFAMVKYSNDTSLEQKLTITVKVALQLDPFVLSSIMRERSKPVGEGVICVSYAFTETDDSLT